MKIQPSGARYVNKRATFLIHVHKGNPNNNEQWRFIEPKDGNNMKKTHKTTRLMKTRPLHLYFEQDQSSTPPPLEVHMPLQADECTKRSPPQGHKRHHESSSWDSDKELTHDSIDSLQLALVSPTSGGWIQVKKKQGKKGKTWELAHSGLGFSSL